MSTDDWCCCVGIPGIDKVEISEDLLISAMYSPEGERVPTKNILDPKNKNVEVWLLEVSGSKASRDSSCQGKGLH